MNDRIEQFRKMAQANPDDDLAHFALGNALVDSERFGEAVPVLRHVIKINSGYSRAYVLLANSQFATEDETAGIETLQKGYAAAITRGDLMPANEMKQRLSELEIKIDPEYMLEATESIAEPEEDREPGEGEIRCHRTKRVGAVMTFDPFGDEVGAFIQQNITQESWEGWMELSIKVINELRLDLGDVKGQRTYDEHMRDYLNLPGHFFESKVYD
jgi:Fe-S cluster biosynthesis and repair protein YggX